MRRRFASILLLLPVAACAWPQSTAIPDTPAGYTLQAWLCAFDSDGRLSVRNLLGRRFRGRQLRDDPHERQARWDWQSVGPSNERSSTPWWSSFTNCFSSDAQHDADAQAHRVCRRAIRPEAKVFRLQPQREPSRVVQ